MIRSLSTNTPEPQAIGRNVLSVCTDSSYIPCSAMLRQKVVHSCMYRVKEQASMDNLLKDLMFNAAIQNDQA